LEAGAERLLGYTVEEVIGQAMMSLLPKSLLDQERSILEKVQRCERVHHFDPIRIHQDGRLIPVSLTVSTIRNSSGEIIGVSQVVRDLSETRQLKNKLQMAQKMEAPGQPAVKDMAMKSGEWLYGVGGV
jgi:PAS domain S-box-containing protein